jgi:hypothetical protein
MESASVSVVRGGKKNRKRGQRKLLECKQSGTKYTYILAKKGVVYNSPKNYIVICTGKLFGCQVVRLPMWLSGCHVVVNLWVRLLGEDLSPSLPTLRRGRPGGMNKQGVLSCLCSIPSCLASGRAVSLTQRRNAVTPFMRHATSAGYDGGKIRRNTFTYV